MSPLPMQTGFTDHWAILPFVRQFGGQEIEIVSPQCIIYWPFSISLTVCGSSL